MKKQFILKGNEIYQLLINKLTEEDKYDRTIPARCKQNLRRAGIF